MEFNDIKTLDDFQGLSFEKQLEFKQKYNLAYMALFQSSGNEIPEPLTSKNFDWRQHTKELNFYPQDIRTVDDFEALNQEGKLFFKLQFPEMYKKVFAGT